tara:strand:+ start:864 stop:1052 length:189 start_codon:yes stop_codon:yes gene_type:complete
MKGWNPIKGMKIKVNGVVYVVSSNPYSNSEVFEYRNKITGKTHASTVSKFDEGVRQGLIELV